MMLAEVMDGVAWEAWEGPRTADIRGLAYRADAVREGDAFCTWRGAASDGHVHVPAALARGARALVVEQPVAAPGVPVVRVASGRHALARMAANLHGHPARSLAMAGVTGTNGKTSTVFLLHHLLESSGMPCGLIGTIRHQSGQRVLPSSRTTPESLDLQALLAAMRDDGCRAAAMEVSSHALDQGRVDGISYQVAVFTNLTQDHLDYHRTMERYFEAKSRLFAALAPGAAAVVNWDDPWGRLLVGRLPAGVRLHAYALDGAAPVRAEHLALSAEGASFTWQRPTGAHQVRLPWIGAFNVANALGAAEAACALGLEAGDVAAALASAPPVPGRMEKVPWDGPFTVLVDYAHTDDALRHVLATLRPLARGRLRVLAGCGGDRDRSKRPLMARAAAEGADDCVFTSDNPRSEDPQAILDEMKAGLADASSVRIIPDRAEAIAAVVGSAGPGDVVLLAGKGHEATQEISGVHHPFSDREHARQALAAWKGGPG
jgi:UDP-N-acetylmuramoyl-L-alanyl-D-glutamate--2,6-diaminopimelate ligase